MKLVKYIICTIFLFRGIDSYSQYTPIVITEYSKIKNGKIGKEEFTFSFNNSYIQISDNYSNISKKYGPTYLYETGYSEEGFYFEHYQPDVKNHWESFSGNKQELKAYRFVFDNKGGNILFVTEIKAENGRAIASKIYYTEKGYLKATGGESLNPLNNTELKENNSDIYDIVMNSITLSQIEARIKSSFEQDGDKKITKDGQMFSINYKNSSMIKPLIFYNIRNESIAHIILIMPISNMTDIGKDLLRKFGTREVNGEEVIQRGELTYNPRSEGEVGIMVIY
jgi:hypothetical protein